MVAQHGPDLRWEIGLSQRGKMTPAVFGPEKIPLKSFYLYAIGGKR
jgi:hypothetical protein